jgi:NADH dehydrogenase
MAPRPQGEPKAWRIGALTPKLHSSVGSLMGSLTKGNFFIEGQLAKIMCRALHKQHTLALGGWKKTLLITLPDMIDRSYCPRIKLH